MGKCWSSLRGTSQPTRQEIRSSFVQELRSPLLNADLPEDTPVIYVEVCSGHGPWEDHNPYVEIRLMPEDSEAGSQVQRTSHRPRNNKPCWEPPESFKIICSDIKGRAKLVVSVISEETALGVGYVPCNSIADEKESKIIKLSNPDSGKSGVGEIEVNIYRSTIGEALNHDQHVCYEFQRLNIVGEWGADYPGHLLPTDPGRYCSQSGHNFNMKFDEVVPDIPPGWETSLDWRVVSTSDDPEGWLYGVDFTSTDWFKSAEAPGGGILGRYVRRRMWAREIKNISSSKRV